MSRRPQPLRVAIDTGGTFTDCVWRDSAGRLRMLKVFSTPGDPSQSIVEALSKIPHAGELTILHGTTVGTNTLLERKGARTALVTTKGFEDAIEIGRQARPKLYDFFFDRVEPLVPADLRFGVEERTASDGEILTAPTSADLRALVSEIRAKRPEAIAISLLFSFANPKNELAIAEALGALGVPLSVSHQILPEFREYERSSTVVINAYLQPVMQKYLENLERRAGGPQRLNSLQEKFSKRKKPTSGAEAQTDFERLNGTTEVVPFPNSSFPNSSFPNSSRVEHGATRIFVMQSSGGITALAAAAREPVRTVLSGPAGGVVGAAAAARASEFDRIIAFDMGGTSTDVSLVEGTITTASHAEVAGLPVGVPMLDIHTVGAGGGSLARFDAGGVLRVGPESAGADPGPICYGRGLQPTVTDANLLLGRLQPTRFLGGDFTLDLERTRRITREWLTRQGITLTLEKFAAGVIRVVNATMEKAIRMVSIERGRDPRDFALVTFGGAGGLHACALAEALSIPRVIVPALPGALSALGILVSDVVKDYSRTVLWRVAGKLPAAALGREFSALQKQAAKDFRDEAWRGKVHYQRSVDLRYSGQGYELGVPFGRNLLKEFEREHFRRYGYAHATRDVELVTLRLRAVVKNGVGAGRASRALPGLDGQECPSPHKPSPHRPSSSHGSSSSAHLLCWFEGRKLATRIYARDELWTGKSYSGPAIVTEYSATTVVPPNTRFRIDRAAGLVVEVGLGVRG